MSHIPSFFLLLLILFHITIKQCITKSDDEIVSDEEKQNIGAAAGDIISTSSSAPTQGKTEPPTDPNIAGDILKGVRSIPAPTIPTAITFDDEELIDPEIICDRDYNYPCPNDYNYIGSVHDDDEEICAPSATYDGPCKGQELSIKSMTNSAKEHWSTKCKAFWPCKRCIRNFTSFCPEKWVRVKGTVRTCEPTAEYIGPCNFQMNFLGHNIPMLQEWSLKCRAWWKCDHIELFDDCPDKDYPITSAATKWRIKKNYQ